MSVTRAKAAVHSYRGERDGALTAVQVQRRKKGKEEIDDRRGRLY